MGNEAGSGGGGDDDTNDPPVDDPNTLAGSITESRTLSGAISIAADTTIESGVTLTVSAGTTITVKSGKRLSVKGTLSIEGTSASKVAIDWENGSNGSIPVSGTANITYLVMHGGAITTTTGAAVTITDSLMAKASGDLLIMSGGSVTMTYSQIGEATGDTTHCNLHFGGNANTVNITKSNIVGAPYGLMFYGGTAANFRENNWMAGTEATKINVDTQPGVSGDFSLGYFDKPFTPGAGAQITMNDLAAAPLTDAGVRP
ncbi:MAG: hypothetical protein KIT31_13350 [Deltaproteobacteria bacterium]|nr:hypothetical protein [Deltaproteobacteria bacterium]